MRVPRPTPARALHLLFNRRENPSEQRNLFYRGGHQDVVARFTKEIHAWQKRTGDKLAV